MTPVFIFDIGNVLIDFDLQGLQQRIAAESGTPFSCIQCRWANDDLRKVETGKMSGPEYFRRFCEFARLPWTYDEWIHAWMSIYSENSDGQDLFGEMKGRDYPVCALSNLAPYNWIALQKKFSVLFKQATRNFLSYRIQLHKPDPSIYNAVCHNLGVEPRQCFFLDDSPKNVKAARQVGMRAYVFSAKRFSVIKRRIECVLRTGFQ